jgi:hemolysin activation/secretion protein
MKRCLAYALLVALFVSLGPGISSAEPVAVPRFDIKGYRVEGNTLLPPELVRKTLARFTGSGKDFGTVQEALEALQEEYRCRGYSTVHVLLPEQELERGEVWLQVAEGRLSAVKVEGNASFDQQNIRRSIPGLVEGKVPDIDSVSASLSVANENPAKKVSLQLQSGEKQDELTALVRVVDERPWRIGLNIENTGSRQTGEWRLGALFQHANLFNLDHLLTLQYVTAPERPSKVAIYSAGYRIPLYSLGDSIDLFGGYSDVDSGTVAAGVFDLKVSGRGIISGCLLYTSPSPRDRTRSRMPSSA